ncbi:hypothetical protein FBU30_002548 [Linnemannia zychae]|nr:hypothetical protein FBU30_002548 [Linnemannia zychae]
MFRALLLKLLPRAQPQAQRCRMSSTKHKVYKTKINISAAKDTSNRTFLLYIPELLELILSFLSDCQLRLVAQVCRQWRPIALQLLHRQIKWVLARDNDENNHRNWTHQPETTEDWAYLNQRKLWKVCTHADRYPQPESPYYNFRQESWEALVLTLQEIAGNPRFKQRRLEFHMTCSLDIQKHLLPLLSIVGPNLKRLVIDQSIRRPIALVDLLDFCPQLAHLSISYQHPNLIRDDDLTLLDNSSLSPMKDGLKLHSLILKDIFVQRSALLSILAQCPDLQLLRLSRFETYPILPSRLRTDSSNPLDFFASIVQSCPRLKSVQFSKAYGSEPTNHHYCFEYYNSIAKLFPLVTEWTFEVNDMFKMRVMDENLFLGPEFGHLTTLVIEGLLSNTRYPEKRLNSFLVCPTSSAHKLLHLRVTGLAFSIWWWDLELRQGNSRAMLKKEVTQNEFFSAKIWRCRSLKTLHVRLWDKDEAQFPRTSMRLMCGYVSKVFPVLEDLLLEKSSVDFEMDSGLCLLTRLSRLKSLTVVGLDSGRIEKGCLDWLARDWASRSRTKKQLENEWRQQSKPCGTQQHPKPGESVRDYVVDGVNMRYIGQVQDVVEVVKERLADGGMCWPQMEFLKLQLKQPRHWYLKNNGALKAKVLKMRPEIEFCLAVT